MRALVFNPTIPRFLVTKALGTVSRAAVMARTSALQFREIPEPPLPGDEWVRIGVRLGGICGSDLHTIRLETSPAMSALTSFPFVLGHENVGAVLEAGRAVGSNARIVALVRYPFQGEAARRQGANTVVLLRRGDRYYAELADVVGGTLRRPMIGRRVLIGGADLTIECVGSGRSLDDALRLTAPGGRVILLGLAAVPSGVDWTPIWWKELRVTGSYVYGIEQWQGRTAKTMELVLAWMARGDLHLDHLVTHRFPLDAYRDALRAAMGKAESKAFKVVFEPNAKT